MTSVNLNYTFFILPVNNTLEWLRKYYRFIALSNGYSDAMKIFAEILKPLLGCLRRKGHFLKLLFGCPTANFGPLSRGQPQSPYVNHCVFTVSIRRLPGAS